jgi:hypothetical protein
MKVMLITTKMNITYLANAEVFADKVKMKEPVQVIIQATKDGPMMAFLPYLEYSDEFKVGIEIPYEAILTINTPVKELQNQYNQMFGSGIQIASAMPSKF